MFLIILAWVLGLTFTILVIVNHHFLRFHHFPKWSLWDTNLGSWQRRSCKKCGYIQERYIGSL